MDVFHCMFICLIILIQYEEVLEGENPLVILVVLSQAVLCHSKTYGEIVKFDSHALVAMPPLHQQKTSRLYIYNIARPPPPRPMF